MNPFSMNVQTMYDLRILTNVWLNRLYVRVWAKIGYRNGYQPFGYDWTTLSITEPGYCDILIALKTEALRRLHS